MEKKKIGLAVGLLGAAIVLSISLVTAKNVRRAPQDIGQTTFQVLNLTCGSCLATIEEELRQSVRGSGKGMGLYLEFFKPIDENMPRNFQKPCRLRAVAVALDKCLLNETFLKIL